MNYCPPFLKPFLLFFLLGVFSSAIAQMYPDPGTNRLNAPIVTCLDGFSNRLDPASYNVSFPGFCGDLQNAHWVGFVAERTDMVLSCEISGCVGGNNGGYGVQLTVLGIGNDCSPSGFYTVLCDGSGNWDQQDFNLTGLEIGRVYYVCLLYTSDAADE